MLITTPQAVFLPRQTLKRYNGLCENFPVLRASVMPEKSGQIAERDTLTLGHHYQSSSPETSILKPSVHNSLTCRAYKTTKLYIFTHVVNREASSKATTNVKHTMDHRQNSKLDHIKYMRTKTKTIIYRAKLQWNSLLYTRWHWPTNALSFYNRCMHLSAIYIYHLKVRFFNTFERRLLFIWSTVKTVIL